jgi:hypothetical protein
MTVTTERSIFASNPRLLSVNGVESLRYLR